MIVSLTTWTDHPCGCTSSDDGWWVVALRCNQHAALVPSDQWQSAMRTRAVSGAADFGPFMPGGSDA